MTFSRRSFLADFGMGFPGLALGALLAREGIVRGEEDRRGKPGGSPHFAPKAKSVIWLFMVGGANQMETFDPMPELNKHGGKTFEESPDKAGLESPHLKQNRREVIAGLHEVHPKIFPMRIGRRKRGQTGRERPEIDFGHPIEEIIT